MYKNLYLKKGKEESLERFHPWIFSGAIHHIEGEPEEGEVVRVLTSEGDFIDMKREMIPTVWCTAKETVCQVWWWMCMERQPSCRPIAWACTWRATK